MSQIDTDTYYDGGRNLKEQREECPGCGMSLDDEGNCLNSDCEFDNVEDFEHAMDDGEADRRYEREEDRRLAYDG